MPLRIDLVSALFCIAAGAALLLLQSHAIIFGGLVSSWQLGTGAALILVGGILLFYFFDDRRTRPLPPTEEGEPPDVHVDLEVMQSQLDNAEEVTFDVPGVGRLNVRLHSAMQDGYAIRIRDLLPEGGDIVASIWVVGP